MKAFIEEFGISIFSAIVIAIMIILTFGFGGYLQNEMTKRGVELDYDCPQIIR